jgi:hypothetical protein
MCKWYCYNIPIRCQVPVELGGWGLHIAGLVQAGPDYVEQQMTGYTSKHGPCWKRSNNLKRIDSSKMCVACPHCNTWHLYNVISVDSRI